MQDENEVQDTQKVGRRMLLVGWIIALGMLAYLFSGILDEQHNPNQRVQSTTNAHGIYEVELLRNRQGHYVANGWINNQPVVFLLDTGATVVSVPERVANRLKLKPGIMSYSETANGTIETYSTRLDSVGLGEIQLNNVAAHINPYMEGDEILLGMSFLKHLELMQKGDTLTLRQP